MLAIINAELIMRDHLIPDGYILIENGILKDYGEMFKAPSFDGCEIIDAGGYYVGPGLVDIHCHAADDCRFVDDPIPAAQYMLKHGTTTILPTPSYSLTREKILSGEAEGIVLHTNTMADLDYEAYDAALAWMDEHGDEEIPE